MYNIIIFCRNCISKCHLTLYHSSSDDCNATNAIETPDGQIECNFLHLPSDIMTMEVGVNIQTQEKCVVMIKGNTLAYYETILSKGH